MNIKPGDTERGFTLFELLVAVGFAGILSSTVVYSLRDLNSPSDNASAQVMTYLKKARAKALATTFALRVGPSSNGRQLTAGYADSCTATTFTSDPEMTFNLPTDATFADPTWRLCFSARGMLSTDADIEIEDPKKSVVIEVALGGGMRLS